MIVRIPYLMSIAGERLYDLSDGSLSLDPIGVLKDGREVFSAEALLEDIAEYESGYEIRIIVTAYTEDDIEESEDGADE